jgi:hypothetical protein
MRIFYGICALIAGLALWILAFIATASWLAFCFGTVIVGLLLLIFAPTILFAPMILTRPGTGFLVIGMDLIVNKRENGVIDW